MGRKAQTWDDVGPTVARFMGSGKSDPRSYWVVRRTIRCETFFHKGGSSSKLYPPVIKHGYMKFTNTPSICTQTWLGRKSSI